MVRLSKLLDAVTRTRDNYRRHTRYRAIRLCDCDINALGADSRRLRVRVGGGEGASAGASGGEGASEGALFFALRRRGAAHDGHRFIGDAIRNGARAIVYSRRRLARRAMAGEGDDISYIHCRQPQVLMSACAHLFFGRPSERMYVIGVTGTDGKSTTAYFIYQLLRALGIKCGLISTVMLDVADVDDAGDGGARLNRSHQTTPHAPYLHRALAAMRRAGYTHVVVETSSHALAVETSRVAHIRYDAAIVTNISREHLEFHRTPARYRRAKARLLQMLGGGAAAGGRASAKTQTARTFVLTAADDATQRYLRRYVPRGVPCIDYRAASSSLGFSYRIVEQTLGRATVRITQHPVGQEREAVVLGAERETREAAGEVREVEFAAPFFGEYNIQNAIAALKCAEIITDYPLERIVSCCASMCLPPGRLQRVDGARHGCPRVFVDYAHTAASMRKVLTLFRPLATGRLAVLFGSAGERDIAKRAEMGKVAAQYADIIYISEEDPRGEERADIAADIMRGVQAGGGRAHIILDRERAIATAIAALDANDILLLLGKGHEQTMIYRDREVQWDEVGMAKKYL